MANNLLIISHHTTTVTLSNGGPWFNLYFPWFNRPLCSYTTDRFGPVANLGPEDGPVTHTFKLTHDHLPDYTMPCHNDPPDSSALVKYTVFAMGGRIVWHKFTYVSKERTASISNEKSSMLKRQYSSANGTASPPDGTIHIHLENQVSRLWSVFPP
jgi:hypothetical protein